MRRATRLASTAGCAFFAATAAAAQAAPSVTYDDTFTTRAPGAPSGRIFNDSFADANDPNAKPPPVSHFHLQLPAGARFDTSAVPQCGATDAELMAQGAAACPAASRVGGEVFLGDTGFPEPNRHITADVDFLNEKDGLIIVSRDRSTGARVVSHGIVRSDTEDIDVPLLPGTPPDGGTDAREQARFSAVTGPSGAAYLTTPPTCPAGYWTLRATYTFRDGTKIDKESRSPCDRAGQGANGPLRVVFFHRQHTRAGRRWSLRVRASAKGSATLTVTRGGRTAVRRKLSLAAGRHRVRLPALARGTYAVSVRAGAQVRRAALVVRP